MKMLGSVNFVFSGFLGGFLTGNDEGRFKEKFEIFTHRHSRLRLRNQWSRVWLLS